MPGSAAVGICPQAPTKISELALLANWGRCKKITLPTQLNFLMVGSRCIGLYAGLNHHQAGVKAK
jgi:hypothetical protein